MADGIYGCLKVDAIEAQHLLGVALRAVLAGGLALGLSWVLLAVVGFLVRHTLAAPWQHLRTAAYRAREGAARRRTRLRDEERQRRAQEEHVRTAPEREQARREAEVRAQIEAEAKKKREDARLSCEILYASLQPEIAERFSREMFDDFMRRHMGDEHPAERVEERALQLQAVLQRHREKVDPQKEKPTIESLSRWRQEARDRILAAGLDPTATKELLVEIDEKFDDSLKKLIGEL